MRTAREDALLLLLLDPVFRASFASGRDRRRMSPPEALIVFSNPPLKLIGCFSDFYINSRSYVMCIKKQCSRRKHQ